jgi:hypothetical protein
MPINDFLPFATGATANVTPQAAWAASTVLTNGQVSGYAKSADNNKAVRQPSFISAGLAKWVFDELGTVDIRDDGNLAEWEANLDAALRKLILSYVRIKEAADVNVYVSIFTGNDANSGLSAGSPFKTIQTGVNYCLNAIDLGPYNCTIHIEGGAGAVYNESILIGGSPQGLLGLGKWQWVTYNGQVTINGTGYTINISGGGQLMLNGQFLLSCTAAAGYPNGVLCPISGSRLACTGSGLTFGNSPGCIHVYPAEGGEFSNASGYGSYTIAGGALEHWRATSGYIVVQNDPSVGAAANPTITLQGTPNFTNAFATGFNLGVIHCPGLTFPGTTATGAKFALFENSVINTAGAGQSYLPGSTPGSVGTTGGQYV